METEQGATIPFHSRLSRTTIDEFADKLVEYMTAQGYDDFDIECPTDEEEELR